MVTLTYRDAVGKALEDCMREEPRLILSVRTSRDMRGKFSLIGMASSECVIPRSARAPWWEWRSARR